MNSEKFIAYIRFAAIALIVLLVPILVWHGTHNEYLLKTLLCNVLVLLVFLSVIVLKSSKKKIAISIELPLIILAAFFLFLVLSGYYSVYKAVSMHTFMQKFIMVLLFMFSACVAKDRKQLKYVLFAWICGFICVFLVGAYQAIFQERIIATFGNPNFFAAYIIMSIGILIAWIGETKQKNRYIAGLYMLLIIAALFLLVLIRSWAAYIGLAAMVLSGIILSDFSARSKKIAFYCVLLMITVIVVFPITRQALVEQVAYDVRPLIWTATFSMISTHLFFGLGPGTYFIAYPDYRSPDYFLNPFSVSTTRHAHNHFFELVSETGIFAGILYVLFLGMLLFVCIRYLKNKQKSGNTDYILYGVLLSLIGIITQNVFSVNLEFSSSYIFFWLMLGVVFGVVYLSGRKEVKRITFSLTLPLRIVGAIIIVLLFFFVVLRPLIGDYYFEKGIRAKEENRILDTIDYYKKAVGWYPYNPDVWYRLAFCYGTLKDFDSAERTYRYILRKFGNFSNTNRNLGIVLSRTDRNAEAVRFFKKEKGLNPYDLNNRSLLLSAYRKQGNRLAAYNEAEEILRIDPENVFAKKTLTLLRNE